MLSIQVLFCLLAIVASDPRVVLKQRLAAQRLAARRAEDCEPTADPTSVPTATPTADPPTSSTDPTSTDPTAAPTTPAPTTPGYSIVSQVIGTFANGGQVTGSYLPGEFNFEQEQLTVTGVLTAVLTRTGSTPANLGNIQQVVTMPVTLPTNASLLSNPVFGGLGNLVNIGNLANLGNLGSGTPLGGLRRLLQLISPPINSTDDANATYDSTGSEASGASGTGSEASGSGECKVLHLTFQAPTGLTLLGVSVQLSPIELDVTAQPGGLLGNLLCSLSGLLNKLPLDLGDLSSLTGGVDQFTSLLNCILDILDLSKLPAQNLGGIEQVTEVIASVTSVTELANLGNQVP